VHPGAVGGPGVPNVLVGGQPAAAAGDAHVCGTPNPHPPTAFAKGSVTVLIGGRPALRAGDVCACGAAVAAGFPTVLIGG
jgi:uncharacterized Zn-binding protein involved in type VI secretion